MDMMILLIILIRIIQIICLIKVKASNCIISLSSIKNKSIALVANFHSLLELKTLFFWLNGGLGTDKKSKMEQFRKRSYLEEPDERDEEEDEEDISGKYRPIKLKDIDVNSQN